MESALFLSYLIFYRTAIVKNGLDVYVALTLLSACIGHKSLTSTEGYVRLTCRYYPELLKQCASLNDFVYPKNYEAD